METKHIITYMYNPAENRLTIIDKGKVVGGFVGDMANKKFYELLETGAEISIGGNNMNKSLKIRQLRALWIRQGCDQYRDAILEPYGVTSTKDLTEAQLDKLIASFTHTNKSDAPLEVRAARSLNLKLLMELGVYDNTGDWTRVNAYLMDKRIAGKLLYQMTIEELKALTVKLRAIIMKNAQDAREIKRLTISN